MTQTILLVGATGQLGGRIAHYLTQEKNVALRLLLRPETLQDEQKHRDLAPLLGAGAKTIEGDLQNRESLLHATEGADTVISAVQGGPEVIIDGQVALAEAAKANGVRRLFPSDFAVDLFKAPEGEHPLLSMRREADERIAALGLETVHVLNGAFMDILLLPFFQVYDAANATFRFWGTGDEPFDSTSIEDTAHYTARAALDTTLPPGKFAIAGQQLTFQQAVQDFEAATRRTVKRESRGTAAELEAWIAKTRAENADPMAVVPALYQLYMMTGRTALDDLQNDRYPDVKPETYADFLRRTM